MGTFIVGLVVLGIAGLAVYKIYKDRKNGSSCGCGCDGCSQGCGSTKSPSNRG